MLVREIMGAYPAFVRSGTDIGRAAELFSVSEVGQLMVLDHEDAFVGQLSEEAVVRVLLPARDDVLGGSVAEAFARFAERGREVAGRPIDPLVVTDGITAAPEDPVAKVAVAMLATGTRRLPVVERGKLVGTVSRADLVRAVIHHG